MKDDEKLYSSIQIESGLKNRLNDYCTSNGYKLSGFVEKLVESALNQMESIANYVVSSSTHVLENSLWSTNNPIQISGSCATIGFVTTTTTATFPMNVSANMLYPSQSSFMR